MVGIGADFIQKLLDQIEELKKTFESAGNEGQIKLKNINLDDVLKEIPRTADGKLDANRWGGLDEGGQRSQHSNLICALEALKAAADSEAAKEQCGYGAALIATSIFLSGAATLFTVIFVLVEWPESTKYSPLWGTLAAFLAWLALSWLCCELTNAKHAIPSSYGELLPRLDELEAGLKSFCPATGSPKNPCKNTAYYEAVKENDEIRKDLAMKGLTWVLATGYSNVWGRLYRAEEAMIEVAPQKKVLEGAYFDEARLEGSDIKNRDDLLAKLRKAVVSIDPSAHKYLRSTAAVTAPAALAIGTTALPGGTVAVGYCAPLLATGGVPPYKWAVIGGAVPDGLVLSTPGVLRGTPTSDGKANFTVQATDSAGVAVEKYFDLLISPQALATQPPLAFTTLPPLPWGAVNVEYAERLFASGGKPPYIWTVIKDKDKKPPEGIDLSPEGLLSGRPVRDGTFNFKVQVVDSTGPGPIDREFTLLIKPSGAAAAVPTIGGTEPEQLARTVLRHVRNSLNGYRYERWNGLILARNRLLATFMLTGMIVFALLAIAIMSGAERPRIIAATVFYLVGATVGLGNRLRSESQAESAMPDYGLSAARLITIPLFSGLGAIGGLLFVAYLPLAAPVFAPNPSTPLAISTDSTLKKYTINEPYSETKLVATGGKPPYNWSVIDATKGAMPDGLKLSDKGVLSGIPKIAAQGGILILQVTDGAGSKLLKEFILRLENSAQASKPVPPVPPPAKGPAEEPIPKAPPQEGDAPAKPTTNEKVPATAPTLEDIFDFKKNLIGLFVAAVFGLAPGLLFDRLQQQADRYKADLKSSKSTEGTQKT